jgi:hydrogenase maturation factor
MAARQMTDLAPHCDHTIGCITCGDEAMEMRVLAVDHERGLALCAGPDGGRSSVETALVEGVREGQTLLVHAGTAIARTEQRPDGAPA